MSNVIHKQNILHCKRGDQTVYTLIYLFSFLNSSTEKKSHIIWEFDLAYGIIEKTGFVRVKASNVGLFILIFVENITN